MKNFIRTKSKQIIFVLALAILFATGVGIRRYVLRAQFDETSLELPFTLESALQYRMTKMVYDGQGLPQYDQSIQYPDGVELAKTYTLGAEYIYSFLAKCIPGKLSFTQRLRWVELLWFCLGIPFLALWIYWSTGNKSAGIVSAAFYAVALSAVVRSTGQELSRENFALPLLIGHLAFNALSQRRHKYAWISMLFLVGAWATWDLIQYYILLWALFAYIELSRNSKVKSQCWLVEWCGLLVLCLILPYARSHSWIKSLPMLLSYGVAIGVLLRQWSRTRKFAGLAIIIPLVIYFCCDFGESYSHFSELLIAKLRFYNIKPHDPSLLTFNQRMMWVPALHSATWKLANDIFPGILLLTLIGFLILLIKQLTKPDVGLLKQLFFNSITVISFCYFVRLHVFVAIFVAGLLGYLVANAKSWSLWLRLLLIMFLLGGWIVEVQQVVARAKHLGRSGVYFHQVNELVDWLKDNVSQKIVLANFGISGSILTYGECPILLHPKFENKVIRKLVENYGEALFKSNEKNFRDWAEAYGAEIYVYSLGEFSKYKPEYQMRYMVDALEPNEDSTARMFEYDPGSSRYFRLLWGNNKYRVFKIIGKKDEQMAVKQSQQALEALQLGKLQEAEDLAVQALQYDNHCQQASKVLGHIFSLHEQNFEYEIAEEEEQK